MPSTYKGLTAPSYADTADGVQAIRDLIDSGPVPRAATAGTLPASPTPGQVAYRTDQDNLVVYSGSTVGWTKPWTLPWGVQTWSTNGDDVTLTTTTTDLPSLNSVEWTVVANRVYRVTLTARLDFADPSDRCVIQMTDMSNNIVRRFYDAGSPDSANDIVVFTTSHIFTDLTPGLVRYKFRGGVASPAVGSVVITPNECPTSVWVEDIGPSGAAS